MTLCGSDCCKDCGRLAECGGCKKVNGHPFGGNCVAAMCVERGGMQELTRLKSDLVAEINSLGIPGLVKNDLYLLNGAFVNLEYTLSNNTKVKFLNDNDVYWGCQIEREHSDRCYGVVANEAFILACEYGCNGTDPELLLFKKRKK